MHIGFWGIMQCPLIGITNLKHTHSAVWYLRSHRVLYPNHSDAGQLSHYLCLILPFRLWIGWQVTVRNADGPQPLTCHRLNYLLIASRRCTKSHRPVYYWLIHSSTFKSQRLKPCFSFSLGFIFLIDFIFSSFPHCNFTFSKQAFIFSFFCNAFNYSFFLAEIRTNCSTDIVVSEVPVQFPNIHLVIIVIIMHKLQCSKNTVTIFLRGRSKDTLFQLTFIFLGWYS